MRLTVAVMEFVVHQEAGVGIVAPEMNYKYAIAHEEMNPKKRHTMEDCHRILPTLEDHSAYSYFGVYDGHGGRQIVDFLETGLETNIAAELRLPDNASVLDRLSRAFLITDMQSRRENIVASGATAVAALLRRCDDGDRTLYVANVGDSRAVLVTERPPVTDEVLGTPQCGYYARRLTYDHRAEDVGEQARISAAGGFIARGR